jgi:hypothetical protein
MRQSPFSSFFMCSVLSITGFLSQTTMSSAQKSDGFTLQTTPGLALVKPQPWSKLSNATVLEFQAFIDRTSTGGAGSGYYEFHTAGGNKRQIPSGRVVKVVVFPDPARIKSLISSLDRKKVQAAIVEIETVVKKFPATKVQLGPSLKLLKAEIAKYDSGQIKSDGIWIVKKDYNRSQAAKLVRLLKAEISTANPPDSFNLEVDPKFVALQEFSKSDPTLQPLADGLIATHSAGVRVVQRAALLTKLADPAITPASATAAVNQLKTLKPGEDPASAAYLKAWDAALATVKTTSAETETLAAGLESAMAAVQTDNPPPQLAAPLEQSISNLNRTMIIFKATSPPRPLLAEAEKTLAVCAVGEGLKKLNTLFQQNQFLMAQDLLGDLSAQAALVGPDATRVLTGLQKFAALKVDEFTRLRAQAKLLADSAKPAEALAVYEQAHAVIPDSTVSVEIEKLKAVVPPKS